MARKKKETPVQELARLCAEAGIELIERPNGHYQLKGKQLVNYYPNSEHQKAYIAGTKEGIKHVTPAEAVAMTTQCVQLDKKDQRKKSYRNERAMLFERQKNCHWCGCALTLETATLEHIYPLSKGGLDNANNFTLACKPCNNARGNEMPELNN